jgi:hypothetical protein
MPRNPQNPGQVAGERHPAAKLTWAIVRRMRRQWQSYPARRPQLVCQWMARYRVTQPAISQVVNYVTWCERPGAEWFPDSPTGKKRRD